MCVYACMSITKLAGYAAERHLATFDRPTVIFSLSRTSMIVLAHGDTSRRSLIYFESYGPSLRLHRNVLKVSFFFYFWNVIASSREA